MKPLFCQIFGHKYVTVIATACNGMVYPMRRQDKPVCKRCGVEM